MPIDAINIISTIQLTPELEELLYKKFEDRLHTKFCEWAKDIVKAHSSAVEEYMSMTYFLQIYKISKQTFFNVLQVMEVDRHRDFRIMKYNVEQFKKARQKYKPAKPLFKRSFIKAV